MDANLLIGLGSVRIRQKEGFTADGAGKTKISNLFTKQNGTPPTEDTVTYKISVGSNRSNICLTTLVKSSAFGIQN